MDKDRIDARGMPCPQPVIKAREAISQAGVSFVQILVDDLAQAENVIAMARNQGWSGKITRQDKSDIEISLTRENTTTTGVETESTACGTPTNLVVLISSSFFGEGDDALGAILIRAFIKTLWEAAPRPQSLIFINGGVKLSTQGSELIEDIQRLADAGTEVLACGTCLDFYNLKDELLVGRISNMFEIASRLVAADRVLRP
jgi:selenium metabolism protein YedF